MKFKLDNVIYMTFFDENHKPIYVTDEVDSATIDTEAEEWADDDPIRLISKPKIGDRMFISVKPKNSKIHSLEIEGFYGGEVDVEKSKVDFFKNL